MNSAQKFTPSTKKLRREKTTVSNHSDSGKDNVQVFSRIRPIPGTDETTNCIKVLAPDTLALRTPDLRSIRKETHYKFRHIFTAFSSQSEIFTHVAYPLLEDLLNGLNGLLFTYGVTGSGKTFTLNGNENDPGIMPRCIDTIFNSIGDFQAPMCVIKSDRMNGFEIQSENDAMQDRQQTGRNKNRQKGQNKKGNNNSDKKAYINDGTRIININENSVYSVFISYVEIYNNSVFDLLDEESQGKSLQNKILREDCRKNMYVNGVTELEVKSAEEAYDLFIAGQNRKKMASTALNAGSSRSHSIFNIRVVQLEQGIINDDGQPTIPMENTLKIGQLSLVDLAGSERTNRTNNTGVRLKEASSINNSLMTLRTCLEILRENQLNQANQVNRLVPYRDSRLTFLFKKYFEGDGSVKMIVCINPSIDDYEENIQVLKFAEMAQDVKLTKPEVNRYNTPRKITTKHNINKHKENLHPLTPAILLSSSKKRNSPFKRLPELPSIKLNWENPGECTQIFEKLIKIMKLRKTKGAELNQEIEARHQEVRLKLVALNQQAILSSAEMKNLKTMIHKERQKTENLHGKLSKVESVNQDLLCKKEELKGQVRNLQNIIDEKDLRINQKVLEKKKVEHKLALTNEKMSQELDVKLRRQRDHLNAAKKVTEDKLRMVRGILDNDTPTVPINMLNAATECTLRSESQIPPQTPKNTSNMLQMPRRNMNKTASANTHRPRRSRSASGAVWLEHNVIKPCPLNTVMQPSMKKRKSVSKLDKASDITNPKQSKYCLVAQEPDTEGEMETRLYKADILATCSGGAQVVFNDVERLRQESPTKE